MTGAEKRRSLGVKRNKIKFVERMFMVSVNKINEENGVITLQVTGVDSSFVNAIRRVIMQDVLCMAIEDVSIYENDSVMFDELLAHRLGLLPIKSDAKGFKRGDSIKMVLDKEGPCTVYSKDIKSTDPKIEVADNKIPLVKLGKGQKLKMEMKAVMLSGREHVKWQPGVVSFNEDGKGGYEFSVEPNGSLSAKQMLENAVAVLKEKTDEFEKELKKIK